VSEPISLETRRGREIIDCSTPAKRFAANARLHEYLTADVREEDQREVLHVLPRGFVVDGQEGVKDPLGMSAVRLEVETHIVAGAATSVQNLSKCVTSTGVQIDEMVISSLAAAEATLTDTEKELGVLVAGADQCDGAHTAYRTAYGRSGAQQPVHTAADDERRGRNRDHLLDGLTTG
jgi:hypothetical protein